ncbi:MAG: lytic transglycosylase domain-containing protein [Anaerolineae bacterium]
MSEPGRPVVNLWRALPWILLAIVLVAGLIVGWPYRHELRSTEGLWRAAQRAEGVKAAQLYDLLAERTPVLADYWLLWSAQARMPAPDAIADLVAVSRTRPDSPAAYESHLTLARYYASIESPQTVTAYQEALKLDDRADIRLELARYLEEQHATSGAYRQYMALLGSERADAFVGMRRTAPDALTLASDLLELGYRTDVLDVLRDVDACQADCLRAQALSDLGRSDEATPYQEACLACQQEGLGGGEPTAEEPAPDADAAKEPAPDDPLATDDPIAWWSYTWSLEEADRLDEALQTYLRIAATDAYVADDAAYRAYVLASRAGDVAARDQALALLNAMQPNWLAYRATGSLVWDPAPDFTQQAIDELAGPTLAIVVALEELGRHDLALRELRHAGRVSEIPEVILAMGEGLAQRGEVREAWALALGELHRHPYAAAGFWRLAYPRIYGAEVEQAANRHGVDAELLWAIMRQESAYDPDAVSYVGARGLMQFMPATQRQMIESVGRAYVPGDAFQPAYAIEMGSRYLRSLLDMFDGRLDLAIMAYNAGPGAVGQWIDDPLIVDQDDMVRFAWYGETREYLTRVMLDRELYKRVWADGE